MAKITHIVLHCSDSKYGTAGLIKRWHTDPKPKGNGWKDIGYHFVILNGRAIRSTDYQEELDGLVEQGRFQDGDDFLDGDEIGAHAYMINDHTLGICLIGTGLNLEGEDKIGDFTPKQMMASYDLVRKLMEKHDIPIENVIGHYESEFANGKTCPNIDMVRYREWVQGVSA